jgi:hypothetical protein
MALAEGQGCTAVAVVGILLVVVWTAARLLGIATYSRKKRNGPTAKSEENDQK